MDSVNHSEEYEYYFQLIQVMRLYVPYKNVQGLGTILSCFVNRGILSNNKGHPHKTCLQCT